ncbi:MAG: hypothetical protein ABI647_23490 [Gemmatimonadota bacterium]
MRIALFVLPSLLAMATATAQTPDPSANCRAWPAAPGPYRIGTVEFEVTDSLRSSQYAPTPTPVRRLYVRAWYPATTVSGPRRTYFTAAEAPVLPAALMSLLGQTAAVLAGCASLETNSYQGASPAPGRFPVIGFNHGYTSYAAQQTALFEHLAANGYVVIALGHPYESGGVVYPNGDAYPMSPAIAKDLMTVGSIKSGPVALFGTDIRDRVRATGEYVKDLRKLSLGQLAPVWRDDVYFALDRLEDGAVPDVAKPLAAAIDHDRRGYMGMSYGGYIAAMLAQGDARAKAAVNLDGGNWTYELVDRDLRTAFLMLNSDAVAGMKAIVSAAGASANLYRGPYGPRTPTAGDVAYERVAAAGLRSDIFRVMIPGLLHLGITDFGELFGPALMPVLGDAGAAKRFTAVQNDLVLGFLDRYVKGKTNGFPKAALAAHPELLIRDRADIRRQALRRAR